MSKSLPIPRALIAGLLAKYPRAFDAGRFPSVIIQHRWALWGELYRLGYSVNTIANWTGYDWPTVNNAKLHNFTFTPPDTQEARRAKVLYDLLESMPEGWFCAADVTNGVRPADLGSTLHTLVRWGWLKVGFDPAHNIYRRLESPTLEQVHARVRQSRTSQRPTVYRGGRGEAGSIPNPTPTVAHAKPARPAGEVRGRERWRVNKP